MTDAGGWNPIRSAMDLVDTPRISRHRAISAAKFSAAWTTVIQPGVVDLRLIGAGLFVGFRP